MPEDRLTHAERVRLEALSQAQQMAGYVCTSRPKFEDVTQLAERIEAWLLKAQNHVQ